ncbi:MAG: tetratricopeptide repeat protein [Candidatus Thorarchaeota archaeon]|nr:tetratricopeptide repeat protein [Candidatus Thorarchaeota archaeon]
MPTDFTPAELQERIRNNPNDADAWSKIGFLLLIEGKSKEAKAMLERAVALDPKNFEAWAGLGVIAANKGALKESEELYKQSVKIQSNFSDGWFALARIYWGQAKYKDAEKALKKCSFETLEKRVMVLRELALVYMMWNKFADAEKTVKQAIQLDPTNTELKIILHRALKGQKSRDKENQAALAYREIPFGTMNLEELLTALGQAMQLGDFEVAEDFGRRIRDIDSRNIDGLFIQHRHLTDRYNYHYASMCSSTRTSQDGWQVKKLDEEIKKLDKTIRSVIDSDPSAKMRWQALFNRYPYNRHF